jgi:hypothetical protein
MWKERIQVHFPSGYYNYSLNQKLYVYNLVFKGFEIEVADGGFSTKRSKQILPLFTQIYTEYYYQNN